MAIDMQFPFQGVLTRIVAQMMTAQNAINDGEWVDFAHVSDFGIHIKDISGGDIVQIRVSNTIDKPDDTENGAPLGRNITTERLVLFPYRVRWCKVKKLSGTASSPNAYLFAEWRVANR